jgi:hypothetical protein
VKIGSRRTESKLVILPESFSDQMPHPKLLASAEALSDRSVQTSLGPEGGCERSRSARGVLLDPLGRGEAHLRLVADPAPRPTSGIDRMSQEFVFDARFR